MSNLIPEVRADVNGKLVTRHVRADAKNTSSSLSIPAPISKALSSADALRHEENLQELQNTVSDLFLTGEYDWQTSFTVRELNQQCLTLGPGVANAFRQKIDENPDVGWEDILISVLDNRHESDEAGYFLFVVDSCLGDRTLDSNWNSGIGGTESYGEAWKAYRGLLDFSAETGRTLPPSIIDSDEQTQKQFAAVLKSLTISYNDDLPFVSLDWDKDEISFDDYALGELAMDYPDDVERIFAIIEDRGMDKIDRELIASILESESQSMSSGVL